MLQRSSESGLGGCGAIKGEVSLSVGAPGCTSVIFGGGKPPLVDREAGCPHVGLGMKRVGAGGALEGAV